MIDFLVVASTLGIIVLVIALIIATVLRKKRRMLWFGLLLSIMVFIISIILYPRDYQYDMDEDSPIAGLHNYGTGIPNEYDNEVDLEIEPDLITTPEPTPMPIPEPTPEPTVEPMPIPTDTPLPTVSPTPSPTPQSMPPPAPELDATTPSYYDHFDNEYDVETNYQDDYYAEPGNDIDDEPYYTPELPALPEYDGYYQNDDDSGAEIDER